MTPEFLISKSALAAPALDQLRAGLLASPLVGKSTLAGSFRGSYGFAVTFTHTGRAQLMGRYPELSPALAALEVPAGTAAPNAWYLNLLVLPAGQAVGRHTDGTLRAPSGDLAALPLWVSVLYLEVPAGTGGELELFRDDRPVGRIAPETGAVVHFRGDLEHAVHAVDAAPGARRVSLVLEQYRLAAEALAQVPAFKLDSRAGFGAHLADHASRPAAPHDLE